VTAVTAATEALESDPLLAWHTEAAAVGLEAERFHWDTVNDRLRFVSWSWWNLNFTLQQNMNAHHRAVKLARIATAYLEPVAGLAYHFQAQYAYVLTARPPKPLWYQKPRAHRYSIVNAEPYKWVTFYDSPTGEVCALGWSQKTRDMLGVRLPITVAPRDLNTVAMGLRTYLIDGRGKQRTDGFGTELIKDVLPSAPEVSYRPGQRR